MTANVFLERTFGEPLTREDVLDGGRSSAWCFDLHRVRWHGSFLARDGRAMVCRFSAPDVESARLALRDPDTDLSRLWAGTVHEAPQCAAPNVVVERSFSAPIRFEDIAALEQAQPWCLETHSVRAAYSFFSLDGKRMLCFYEAPDAEAVRVSQREAAMPVNGVWAGALVAPEPRYRRRFHVRPRKFHARFHGRFNGRRSSSRPYPAAAGPTLQDEELRT